MMSHHGLKVFSINPGADLEENLTGALQLGGQVCAYGALLLGGSGGMPPGKIFEN